MKQVQTPDTDAIGNCHHQWIDTTQVEATGAFTFLDLFAGCGGFSLGSVLAGLRALLAIEWDQWAAATYRHNHRGVRVLQRDIRTISDPAIAAALPEQRPDVIVAGPPCQGFSMAGEGRLDDPRNGLCQQVIRFARILRPSVLVIENVVGLLRDRFRPVLEGILGDITEIGYHNCSVMVLNAADYGVPQLRRRVFIIANRHGLPNPYPLPLFTPDEHRSVLPAIEDLQDLSRSEELTHDWPFHDPETVAQLRALAPGEGLYGRGEAWRRLHQDRPSPTMKWNRGIPAVHPVLPRAISAREMARIQSFPDAFRFRGSYVEAEHMVGNAVPPELARHIALAVRGLLEEVA